MVSRVIPVYIIASLDPHSSHVAKLSALFDCGYFEVSVVRCEDDHDNEKRAFLYAFNNAKETGKDDPCIIVKDCMFSNLSSNDMYNLIRTIIGDDLEQRSQCSNKFDICYLARYLDKCDGTVVLPDITTGGSLVTTKSAEGDDAIMYSPKARDLMIEILSSVQTNTKKHKKHPHQSISDIIQKQLKAGNLKGVATSPPVIQYNPSFGDMQKTWECLKKGHPVPDPNKKDDSSCYTWLPIILLVLILLILLIWFFFW